MTNLQLALIIWACVTMGIYGWACWPRKRAAEPAEVTPEAPVEVPPEVTPAETVRRCKNGHEMTEKYCKTCRNDRARAKYAAAKQARIAAIRKRMAENG
jgi:hypothetical protein